jgi:hypothetical protein
VMLGGFIVLQVYKKHARCALHPKVDGGGVEMHDSHSHLEYMKNKEDMYSLVVHPSSSLCCM